MGKQDLFTHPHEEATHRRVRAGVGDDRAHKETLH